MTLALVAPTVLLLAALLIAGLVVALLRAVRSWEDEYEAQRYWETHADVREGRIGRYFREDPGEGPCP